MELLNIDNRPRKVGFEIEYIGIPIRDTAKLIAKLYDGKIDEKNENLIIVETLLGPFQLEVDVYLLEKLAAVSKKNIDENKIDVEGVAQYILSNFLTVFMPNEIICPPIFVHDLEKLESLIVKLREQGAKGTSASFAYAFGFHINVEPYSLEAPMLLQYLRAFVLLYDYLNKTMQIDATRTITLFAKPYSLEYAKYILSSHYTPDLDTLITDYILYNPSRNYALDLLPLFTYLDPKQIIQKIVDPRIKPRPTFHFRMPNCKVDSPTWSIQGEWDHWMLVEKLAHRKDLCTEMANLFLENKVPILHHFSKDWLETSKAFIEAL